MSWTKIACLFSFCALLAAPVMAQPGLTVDLVGGGSTPTLAGNGGLTWTIGIDPDETMFDTPSSGDNMGVNGASTGLDIGFDLSGGLSASAAAANAGNFDQNTPGNSTFDPGVDESADGDGDFIGVQVGVDPTNVFASLGSVYFTDGAVKEALTITTERLTSSSLTTSIGIGGAYDAVGEAGSTHGAIGQGGTYKDQLGVAGTYSYTATDGDADLMGTVSLDDFNTVLFNFGSGTTWTLGNFDGDANTDLDDFNSVLFNFGAASGMVTFSGAGSLVAAATEIPEPSTLAIVALAVGVGVVGVRRRR